MIDIPIGKAIAVVELKPPFGCKDCIFNDVPNSVTCKSKDLACSKRNRKDGKKVTFKLVDWSGEANAPVKRKRGTL